ncbi:hypothetical protein L7F22_011463 [Adiantum nelumboides]|nr:hypothetical protein [Adiantum nelumboides]
MASHDLADQNSRPDCSFSSSSKPHVVMLPFPMQGHITPLMQLSKLLATRGFDVSFVTSEYNVTKIVQAKQGLTATHLSQLGIRLLGIADGLPETQPRDVTCDAAEFFESLLVLRTSFDELVKTMLQEEGLCITCIISDSFLVWSQDVADKWGIPRVAFWPQSLTTFACSISLPKIMADLDPFDHEVYRSEAPRVLNCIPGLPDMDARKLPHFALGGEVSVNWLRQHLLQQMERVNEPLGIICNTFPNLEAEVLTHLKAPLLSKPIFTLGPLLPSAFLGGHDDKGTGSSLFDEDEECMQWLDTQCPRSVLYISLGSFAVHNERDVLEIAKGLEASNVPYLWVIRSVTYEQLTSPLLKAGQGKIVAWAPQLKVLSHEAVGGHLTHCGWNSTIESISLGVPIIGWPYMMEQITNCWFLVEKLNIGLELKDDTSCKIGHVGVEKAIRILMQEEEGNLMRARAANFSSMARHAFNTSFNSNLDSLVQTILHPK